MDDLVEQLTTLFEAAGTAHHEAFIESDGDDPDWAMWYADYLIDKLPALPVAPFTKGKLAEMLVRLSQEHADKAPDKLWSRYYAEILVGLYS